MVAVIVGGVVSTTFIMNDALAELPAASLAVHVTAVVPNEKVEPEAGVHVGAMAPSTMSEADAENVTTAPADEVAPAVISLGTLSIGGVASTVKLPVTVFEFGGMALSFATTWTVWLPSGNMAVIIRFQVLVPPGAVDPAINIIGTAGSPIVKS